MIYLAQSPSGGPVKIGYSDDVPRRIVQLEAHSGQSLVLLATLPGSPVEERTIDARFAHLQFGRTEQIRPASDLMASVGRPLSARANLTTAFRVFRPDSDRPQIAESRPLGRLHSFSTWESTNAAHPK